MNIIAEGHNGLNHWRKVAPGTGEVITECSDDKQTWHPGEITGAGHAKRESMSTPVAMDGGPVIPGAPASRLHWFYLAGASVAAAIAAISGEHLLHWIM